MIRTCRPEPEYPETPLPVSSSLPIGRPPPPMPRLPCPAPASHPSAICTRRSLCRTSRSSQNTVRFGKCFNLPFKTRQGIRAAHCGRCTWVYSANWSGAELLLCVTLLFLSAPPPLLPRLPSPSSSPPVLTSNRQQRGGRRYQPAGARRTAGS